MGRRATRPPHGSLHLAAAALASSRLSSACARQRQGRECAWACLLQGAQAKQAITPHLLARTCSRASAAAQARHSSPRSSSSRALAVTARTASCATNLHACAAGEHARLSSCATPTLFRPRAHTRSPGGDGGQFLTQLFLGLLQLHDGLQHLPVHLPSKRRECSSFPSQQVEAHTHTQVGCDGPRVPRSPRPMPPSSPPPSRPASSGR